MTLPEAIKSAYAKDNARLAGAVADTLRDRYGWNYGQTLAFFQKHEPRLTPAGFDDLMYRADSAPDD